MTDGYCISEGCESAADTRGLCRKHYVRSWRAGKIRKVKQPSHCTEPGCDAKRYCKSLCQKHYHRQYRTGTTELQPVMMSRSDMQRIPMPPLVAESIKRSAVKEARRKRLAKRGLVPCEY